MSLSDDQRAEIEGLLGENNPTKRVCVPDMENIIYKAHPVLDHGFVRVIDYMGDDAAVTQAARVSYGRGTRQINQDQGLINYLLRHRHTTPFEMCEIKFHVKLPIFVARQWIRHRTANVNEYSARYSIMGREFYVPAPENLAVQSTQNRQGRGETLQGGEAGRVLDLIKADSLNAYASYQEMLNSTEAGEIIDPARQGLTRELARMNLSLNYYTEWYWKTDLHNLMHFLKLRADSHAQYEIRVYAEAMCDILKAWCPLTFAAFEKYWLEGMHLSGPSVLALKDVLKGHKIKREDYDLSPREWREFLETFNLEDLDDKPRLDAVG